MAAIMAAVSFHYPSQGFCDRSQWVRRVPALALSSRPSTYWDLLHSDQTGASVESHKISALSKSSDTDAVDSASGSLLPLGNAVGIIGGMSATSNLKFLKKLVSWRSCLSDDGESTTPFLLCSDPALHREISYYESSLHQYSSSRKKLETDDNSRLDQISSSIVDNLLQKRKFLENSGIGCIVMPCHISHLWYDEVCEGSSVPFFHVGDCIVNELKEAKLNHAVEAGSPLRVGVLSTSATMLAGFYQEKLQHEGFEVILPDKATMEHIVIPAAKALHRKDVQGARNLLRVAIQVLLVEAVTTIILASDDMRDLLPEDDPLLKKCLDPVDALARSAIRWVQSVRNG